jgi:uncharacterized protein (TIGR02118 family)
MRFCWFLAFEDASQETSIGATDKADIMALIAATPSLVSADIHSPASASDIYTADGPSPPLALQLYFDELTHIEAALAGNGHLQALARSGAFPSLARAKPTHQAMYARHFQVAEPAPKGRIRCSFLVSYPGEAEDPNAWLNHYIASHPPIMRRFLGIRQIEILSRVDWIDALPFERANAMQRNRVVFDSPEALTAALQSPVRHELRADYYRFPPFEGGSLHFPMLTETITPAASR